MSRWLKDSRGVSFLEVVAVVAMMGIAGGMAVAPIERGLVDVRTRGAARAFAMRLRQARADAIQRSAVVGFRFETAAASTSGSTTSGGERAPTFRPYLDGNGNGLRSRDIATRVDPPLGPATTLAGSVGHLSFGLGPTVPAIADDDTSPGGGPGTDAGPGDGAGSDGSGDSGTPSDPIRLGASDLLSFSPTGSSTSGTIYLQGLDPSSASGRPDADRQRAGSPQPMPPQFAVRIYGATGRLRLLEFRPESGAWIDRSATAGPARPARPASKAHTTRTASAAPPGGRASTPSRR
jgi:type II secretory pathway pseudopilin PulG